MGIKAGFVVGVGVGYVLGAKAGRQRYDDIMRWYHRFTGSPSVQRAAEKTKDVAAESAKRGLTVVQQGVEKAGTAVKSRLHKDESPADAMIELIEEEQPGVDYSK
jgi:hypothetical protein